jgi:hypothetical protein
MAEKHLVFTDQDQIQLETILIDKDKDEALKFMANLVQRIKGTLGHACGTGPIKNA